MIFAPAVVPVEAGLRDHHSDPLAHGARQYRSVKFTVVGCSPAWPNPGSAHSGYLVEEAEGRLLLDCGPGVLADLRDARRRLAEDRRDRRSPTGTSTTGATSCRGSGGACSGSAGRRDSPELWVPPGRDRAAPAVRRLLRDRDMFDGVFTVARVRRGREPFRTAPASS